MLDHNDIDKLREAIGQQPDDAAEIVDDVIAGQEVSLGLLEEARTAFRCGHQSRARALIVGILEGYDGENA